jgi:hypothetical protein
LHASGDRRNDALLCSHEEGARVRSEAVRIPEALSRRAELQEERREKAMPMRLPEKDVVYEDAGTTREEWDAKNASEVERAKRLSKKRKLKFKPQRKDNAKEKKERQSLAPSISRQIEQMKSRGMSGLDRDGVNASKRRLGR